MGRFVQVIEFQSSRVDELRELGEKYRTERSGSGPVRGTVTADRDRPGTYLNIVEFESWEEAQANSEDPRTQEFAKSMGELCDGPPRFYNLDVVDAWER